MQLLSPDEKVLELQQLLESRSLENDELKVQLDQNDQGSGMS